jgi:hypothetical protein
MPTIFQSVPSLTLLAMIRHPCCKLLDVYVSLFSLFMQCARVILSGLIGTWERILFVFSLFVYFIFYFGSLGPLSPRRRVLFPQTSGSIRVSASDGWFMSPRCKPSADVRCMLRPSSISLTAWSYARAISDRYTKHVPLWILALFCPARDSISHF